MSLSVGFRGFKHRLKGFIGTKMIVSKVLNEHNIADNNRILVEEVSVVALRLLTHTVATIGFTVATIDELQSAVKRAAAFREIRES